MKRKTFQTVRLSVGRHRSLQEGACVMELASVLAGEPFSDRPRSVCPVLGAFLRGYNDYLPDDRRHELRAVASLVVGSRSLEPDVARRRAERLLAMARAVSNFPWAPRRGHGLREMDCQAAGQFVARAVGRRRLRHADVAAVLAELVPAAVPEPVPVAGPVPVAAA